MSHRAAGAEHSVRYPNEKRIYFAYPGQIGAGSLTRWRVDRPPASAYRQLPVGQGAHLRTQAFNGNRGRQTAYDTDDTSLMAVT